MCQICINGTFRTECLPNKNAKLYWNQEKRGRGKKKKQEGGGERKKEIHIRLKEGVLMAKEKGWSESGQVS